MAHDSPQEPITAPQGPCQPLASPGSASLTWPRERHDERRCDDGGEGSGNDGQRAPLRARHAPSLVQVPLVTHEPGAPRRTFGREGD